MEKANLDIRQYMEDRGVTQKMLASQFGVAVCTINRRLNTELSVKGKETYLAMIDAIASEKGKPAEEDALVDESNPAKETESEDVTVGTKFQIGDRVKIPSKANKLGIVSDIWHSIANDSLMYAVEDESDGHLGLYAENQLEPAPLPINYSFDAHIDGKGDARA